MNICTLHVNADKKSTLPPWYRNTYVPDIFRATKSFKNAPCP